MIKQQRCLTCGKIITRLDMLKQTFEFYITGIISCPHCNEKYKFNGNAIATSRLLTFVPFGLWLGFSDFPLITVILISFVFIFLLGRPLELILNATIFSLFFPLEKASEAHKNNHNEKA